MSEWKSAISFGVARTSIPAPVPTVTTVAGLPASVRKIEWAANANAKYYEVWVVVPAQLQPAVTSSWSPPW